MSGEITIERIAKLRDDARSLRECAARAERYQDGFQDRRYADQLDAEADALEREMNQGDDA